MVADAAVESLIGLLGRIDYGDHPDDVDGLVRFTEAEQILAWARDRWALVEHDDLEHLIAAHGTLCSAVSAPASWDKACDAMWDRLGALQRDRRFVQVAVDDLDAVLAFVDDQPGERPPAVGRLARALRAASQ